MRKQNNSERGFTLIELVVVMFLLSIVSVLFVSVTMMVNNSQQNLRIDSKSQAELYTLEKSFKDRLKQFDCAEFKITVGSTAITVTDFTNDDARETILKFEGKELTVTPDKAETFEKITAITFSQSGNIVCCTAKFDDTDYTHKLLYTIRAAKI